MSGKGYLAVLAFCCACTIGRAQPTKLSFAAITTRQGLSDNRVTAIGQDTEGYMWFGTSVGLNKYNGYTFTVLRADPKKSPNTLHNDVVWDLHEDRTGRFWVSTLGDGLYELNKQTLNLTPHRLSTTPGEQYKNVFYSIHDESDSVLWVGSALGLLRFNKQTHTLRLYPLPGPGDFKVVFCMAEDRQGRLWVGTKMGLYQFNRQTGQYTLLPLTKAAGIKQPLVSALYIDPSGRLWVGTNGEALFKLGAQGEGLFTVDTDRPTLRGSAFNPGGLINKNIALNGIVPHSGDIWVATDDGLQRINPATGAVQTYRADRFSANTLSSSTILSLYHDRDGNLWIGTDNGINKIANVTKQFASYQLMPAMPTVRLGDNSVHTVLQAGNGLIWLGNHLKGLYQFDRQTGRIVPKPTQSTDAPRLSDSHVWSMLEDHRKQLWVGTLTGLNRLNPATGAVTHYPCRIPTQYISEDQAGHLWTGGKKGVARFDPTTGQYAYQDTLPNGGFNFVTDLLVSRTGALWVAQQGVLQQFNPRTGRQVFYRPGMPLKVGELTNGDVSTLFEDSRGLIWVGTERGGLNWFNPATQTFTALTTANGLPGNAIAGITEDKHGALWVSTNEGLSRINPAAGTCRNYNVTDGLPEMEFNPSSVSRNGDGLLFGGTNGVVYFNPDSIRDNTVKPPVYITGLNVRGKTRPLTGSSLTLAHNENSLAFDFIALNYHDPEKNRYVYRLDGVDEGWVDSGFRRFANYTELSPGTYVFRVKASNDDGIWNPKETSLTILITPPWWRTPWAYVLYALLFTGLLWAFIRFRSRTLERKNRLLAQKVAERTQQVEAQKEEIEAQRDNLEHTLNALQATQIQLIHKEKMASLGELTAGIAHEIQNPLNFVNNFADLSAELVEDLKLEQQRSLRDPVLETQLLNDLQRNLQKIFHHGNRTASIVRGMLEHSRISSDDRQPTDINDLCAEYLRLAYNGLRVSDKIFTCELVTRFEADLKPVPVVPQDVGRVVLNLCNNALFAVRQQQQKSPASYQPTLTVSTRRTGDGVEIQVADNGTGMDESVREKVFQPFFTTKDTGEGTGLGLSLSYDIITKGHGGSLTVESWPGRGTVFRIGLPAKS